MNQDDVDLLFDPSGNSVGGVMVKVSDLLQEKVKLGPNFRDKDCGIEITDDDAESIAEMWNEMLGGSESKKTEDFGRVLNQDEIDSILNSLENIENSAGGGTEKFHSGGGSSDYYKVMVDRPLDNAIPYQAQCIDIIMALGMDFAEGEAFKAIWRKAASRQGNGKPGNSALYNAEKVAFFGKIMVNSLKDE